MLLSYRSFNKSYVIHLDKSFATPFSDPGYAASQSLAMLNCSACNTLAILNSKLTFDSYVGLFLGQGIMINVYLDFEWRGNQINIKMI